MSLAYPPPRPQEEAAGRPSKKAASVAIQAHLAVLKGEGLRPALSEALRSSSGLGGQERRFAAFAVRELSRHQRLLDLVSKLSGLAPSALSRLEDQAIVRYAQWRRLFFGEGWERLKPEAGLPGPIRPRTLRDAQLEAMVRQPLPELPPLEGLDRLATLASFPTWLAQALAAKVPEGEVEPLLEALNREPRLILRARPPGTRDEVLSQLRGLDFEAQALALAPDALALEEYGTRVFDAEPVRRGRLQVMDLGSQLIALLCQPPNGWDGATVADVCAGAGGKSLMLGDLARGGQVLAFDASPKRLQEARRRARELGVRNVRFPATRDLSQADVVLIDAPCSGSGSLGREPDQKWKLTAKKIEAFQEKQRALLEEIAPALRPDAVLVYATCSLLEAENQAVVSGFLAGHPEYALEPAAEQLPASVCGGPYLEVLPHRAPGGAFFAARLRKRSRR